MNENIQLSRSEADALDLVISARESAELGATPVLMRVARITTRITPIILDFPAARAATEAIDLETAVALRALTSMSLEQLKELRQGATLSE
jgi:hypothetical protein